MPDLTEDDFWTGSQRDVIGHQDGPIQVIACAGSGKTQTISARIAQMVHEGIDRDSIVAFTFTENAAEELQVRIRDMMEEANPDNPILGNMFVGTVHGFCLDEVLHEFDSDTLNYDVLNQNQLSAFLSRIYPFIELHELGPKNEPPFGKTARIRRFMEDIDAMRRELVEEEIRSSDDPTAQEFIDVYDSFTKEMEKTHFYDFQGIIYEAIKFLENNPEVLEEIRDQFEYLIIDEYQDINFAQERLIELLAGDKKNICVVGDDDQSIFKWRGARTQNFLEFEDKYGGDVERLERNFRSTNGIVDIARDSIERNENRLDKGMFSEVESDIGDIYQNYLQTDIEEAEFIADKIQHHVQTAFEDPTTNEEKPLTYGDFAILFRRKRDMDVIQEELDQRDIPYTVRGQESLFARPETELIRLAFGFIAQGHDHNLQIVDLEESGDPRFESTELMSVSEQDLRETIQNSEFLQDREEKIIATLRKKRHWYSNPTSRRIHPQDELHDVLSAMGMGDPEEISSAEDEIFPESLMYELGQVSKLFQDFETVYEIIFPDQIQDLIQFLDYAAQNSNPKIDDPTLVNAVNLMTIHSAKGMEYPAVFIPGLSTYKFSTKSSGGTRDTWIPEEVFDPSIYEENTEDYRRLFYVAVTRAKKFLFLTGSKENKEYDFNLNPNQFYKEVEADDHSSLMDEVRADPTPRKPVESDNRVQGDVYPTSFTDLRYFQKCPYDYKMRHIYDFAPTIDSAFGYGFAVHDILREIHQRFEGDEQALLPSPGEVKGMVQDPDRFYLRHARGEVDELLRDEAQRVLVDYVTEYSDDIPMTYKAEEPFEYLISGKGNNSEALISGEIDLLERRNRETGEIEEVNILDFKTEQEPDSPHDPQLMASEFQVRLYAAATQSEFDLSTVDGYIHYLSDGERHRVDLSDSKLEQVERDVEKKIDDIMERNFFASPDAKHCGTCDFKDICPHAETE